MAVFEYYGGSFRTPSCCWRANKRDRFGRYSSWSCDRFIHLLYPVDPREYEYFLISFNFVSELTAYRIILEKEATVQKVIFSCITDST